MPTFLFDSIVFGPVNSRRLGISLGINLLPNDCKVCNFNCIYCECGLTFGNKLQNVIFHTRDSVHKELLIKLQTLKNNNKTINTITFAGNGEPTLHPEFANIIDDTIKLRDKFFPGTQIAVLSNSTMLQNASVFDALNKVEKRILKLDSVVESTVKLLNNPPEGFSLQKVIQNLQKFNGDFTLQTLFITGEFKGKPVSNASDNEITEWLKTVRLLKPKEVMIYTIERDTPFEGLQKVPKNKLNEIAEKVRSLGINVQISA